MKRGSLYTLIYAAVLGLVCALTLTVVDGFTATRKAENAEAEEVRNILTVLGVPVDAGAAPQPDGRLFPRRELRPVVAAIHVHHQLAGRTADRRGGPGAGDRRPHGGRLWI